jgi:hypothetical protein
MPVRSRCCPSLVSPRQPYAARRSFGARLRVQHRTQDAGVLGGHARPAHRTPPRVCHQIVKHRASPTTRRSPTTGPGDGARRPCRSTAPPAGSTASKTDAARSARATWSPSRTGHKPRSSGRRGWPPPARRSTSRGNQAGRAWLSPVSSTAAANQPASDQGLLEPDARKRARPVLRGARRRKAPDLPDDAVPPIVSGRLRRRRSLAPPAGAPAARWLHEFGKEEGNVAPRCGTCIGRAGVSISPCFGEPRAVHLCHAC